MKMKKRGKEREREGKRGKEREREGRRLMCVGGWLRATNAQTNF